MEFEHFAINVPEPVGMAQWYVTHCGARIVRAESESPFGHFLADDTGRVFLELYSKTHLTMPDYAAQDAMLFHIAFAVDDADASRHALLTAGATLDSDITADDGSRIVILRDPWGVAVQLCQRAERLTG